MTAPSPATLIAVPVRESCGGYTLAHAFRPKDGEPGMISFKRGSPRTEHQCEQLGAVILPRGIHEHFLRHSARDMVALTDEGALLIWGGTLEELLSCQAIGSIVWCVADAVDQAGVWARLEKARVLPHILPLLRESGKTAKEMEAMSFRLRQGAAMKGLLRLFS